MTRKPPEAFLPLKSNWLHILFSLVGAEQHGYGIIYRRLARAFPDEFRTICGDGLEQLGEDLMPVVWRDQGVAGITRLLADLAMRLPLEYFSTWAGRLKELTMTSDLFEGTW